MGALTSSSFNPDREFGDLTGKVAIVTGGNSGIGFATVQQLASRGAKVYLAARSEAKAKDALERLEKASIPGDRVVWLKLDLSDLAATKAAAQEFMAKEQRLDILVNNAAIIATDMRASAYGVQEHIVVNHFGPFVFTQTLLPLLTKTAREPNSDVRIVNVSSDAHRMVPKDLRFRSIEDFRKDSSKSDIRSKFQAYGATKLLNIYWTNELQRRLSAEDIPIICISVHPGAVRSEGNIAAISKLPLSRLLHLLTTIFFYDPEKGAYTSSFAASSPLVHDDPKKYRAAYLTPFNKIKPTSEEAADPVRAREAWDATEALLATLNI